MTRQTTDTPKDPIVVTFKDRDEPEFQKPDHDPHGETCAAAAHSFSSCDNPDCDESGLVVTDVLEAADGYGDDPRRGVACSDFCAGVLAGSRS